MKFVADECVDGQIVGRLRAEGHEVAYVAEFRPGAGGEAVLETANRTGVLLVTADKDFGDWVFRLRRVADGGVLLRLAGLPEREKAEVVAAVVGRHGEELGGAFTVVTPRGIRIRRAGPTGGGA